MLTVCVGLVLRSKYMEFPIICSLQYSININTVEVDPHSDLLHAYLHSETQEYKPTAAPLVPTPLGVFIPATVDSVITYLGVRHHLMPLVLEQ